MILVNRKMTELVCDSCGAKFRFKRRKRNSKMAIGQHTTTKPSKCKGCRNRELPANKQRQIAEGEYLKRKKSPMNTLPKPKGMSSR